ncbi:RNA-binding protein YlmH, contains S4-like domain [Sporobacter termitidis DSM 10068]|uniref:RNA-binding protein YlmH, contains S4-like domain n=1 Tax=Sporobacter termitidis DSM 10068 TaxID=1123282 RepID=A0A1M5YXP2_9FIRM|nr:YlmH/Sll1252 family protein [Sporobacter termitidis]SHI16618.1 RNA-binding protein YlmH, contains S4-like domain [Sporobacter termitidis DSM 10068]
MQDETELLKKRLLELTHRAFSQQRYTYSEFLTLAEQDALLGMKFDAGAAPLTLLGGYDGAERQIARFGDAALCGYEEAPPLSYIAVTPLSQKFADALTHRDFLGALMALGVRRSVLGDILLQDNSACLVCLESISGFIVGEFSQVKRTSVRCQVLDALPDIAVREPEARSVNVASQRLDALVAAVYKLSRSESQALIVQGKVHVNSRLTENASHEPGPGDIVSVRGLGRFVYDGAGRETKKGRLFVDVRVY